MSSGSRTQSKYLCKARSIFLRTSSSVTVSELLSLSRSLLNSYLNKRPRVTTQVVNYANTYVTWKKKTYHSNHELLSKVLLINLFVFLLGFMRTYICLHVWIPQSMSWILYSKDSSSEARFQILEGSGLQNQKLPYSTNIDTLNEIPEVG